MLKENIKDQKGAILAEYGLLATLIAVACVIVVAAFGQRVLGLFQSLMDSGIF
jgi:Flp pilus assembly pilin Flp